MKYICLIIRCCCCVHLRIAAKRFSLGFETRALENIYPVHYFFCFCWPTFKTLQTLHLFVTHLAKNWVIFLSSSYFSMIQPNAIYIWLQKKLYSMNICICWVELTWKEVFLRRGIALAVAALKIALSYSCHRSASATLPLYHFIWLNKDLSYSCHCNVTSLEWGGIL